MLNDADSKSKACIRTSDYAPKSFIYGRNYRLMWDIEHWNDLKRTFPLLCFIVGRHLTTSPGYFSWVKINGLKKFLQKLIFVSCSCWVSIEFGNIWYLQNPPQIDWKQIIYSSKKWTATKLFNKSEIKKNYSIGKCDFETAHTISTNNQQKW